MDHVSSDEILGSILNVNASHLAIKVRYEDAIIK
jgi:hypothetical protein